MGIGQVDILPGAFRIARDIEPMASPFFSELRRSQQAIYHFFKRLRIAIIEERGDFFGRGRQTDQVKINAAQQRGFVPIAHRV
jgi:hypothetical protein